MIIPYKINTQQGPINGVLLTIYNIITNMRKSLNVNRYMYI